MKPHHGILKALVDLATTLSFVTAPFLGILTYRAVMSDAVPDKFKPGRFLRALAIAAIVFLTAFLIFFLFHRFGGR